MKDSRDSELEKKRVHTVYVHRDFDLKLRII